MGVAIDFVEKKYKTSQENVPTQSSRFDIFGDKVIREDLALSPKVSSTEIDSRMVTVSSLGRDVDEEVTVPTTEELASPVQHDTKSSLLPMTQMPFTNRQRGEGLL